MKMTYPEMHEIFKRIPIGYYLGRRIDIRLSETDSVSCFIPCKDLIIISYPQIMRAIIDLPEISSEEDKERIIRSVIYHEVSHVILTPESLMKLCSNAKEKKVINILEDERIETILRDFYMVTDFRATCFLINHYTGKEIPKNADDAFYSFVRFHKVHRLDEEEWLNRLFILIESYKDITTNSSSYKVNDMAYAYMKLYRDFVDAYEGAMPPVEPDEPETTECPKMPPIDKPYGGDGGDGGDDGDDREDGDEPTPPIYGGSVDDEDNDDGDDDDTTSKSKNTEEETEETKGGDNSDDGDNGENEDNDESKGSPAKGENGANGDEKDTENEDDGKTEVEKASELSKETKEHEISFDKKSVTRLVESVLNKYFDASLDGRLRDIIQIHNRKNKQNGSAMPSYSGRINPRLVGTRDDYKWWTQQNRLGHVRACSKVHMNLFIDNSGSFYENDDKMNTFIQSLNRLLDSKIVDFTFDVITINTRVVEWDDTHKEFDSHGGNCVRPEIKDVIARHQKVGANNINVVLFDGDAHSDDNPRSYPKEPLLHFDRNDTIIITDTYNLRYLGGAKSAKITPIRGSYAEVFIDTVCNMLEHFM